MIQMNRKIIKLKGEGNKYINDLKNEIMNIYSINHQKEENK